MCSEQTSTDIPNYLDWFARAIKCHFDMCHRRIAALVDADGSMASLHELWTDQYDLMALEVNGLAPLVRTLQRDVNRFFVINIGKVLDAEYYQRCGSETGTLPFGKVFLFSRAVLINKQTRQCTNTSNTTPRIGTKAAWRASDIRSSASSAPSNTGWVGSCRR